jgi:hypothetical protein
MKVCSTRLPITKAKWIPQRFRQPLNAPDTAPRPPTPPPLPEQTEDSAWDPSSSIFVQPQPNIPDPAPAPGKSPCTSASHFIKTQIGQWLLDARLLKKRLDVRIQGTRVVLFHNGRYEGACGRITLDTIPATTEAAIRVLVGYERTKANLRPRFLIPETSTETPHLILAQNARPIVQAFGERVVIIGPDVYGNSDLVGNYGLVLRTQYMLPADQACVQVCSNEPAEGRASYFVDTSLCRSRPDN